MTPQIDSPPKRLPPPRTTPLTVGDEMGGREIIEPLHVVGVSTALHAAHGGMVAEEHRDSGEADGVGVVPDADTRDVGDHPRR